MGIGPLQSCPGKRYNGSFEDTRWPHMKLLTDEQFDWQVMNPQGPREECLTHLEKFYKNGLNDSTSK